MGTTSTPAPKQRELLAPDLNIASLAGEKSATYWCGVIPHQEGKSGHPPAHALDVAGVTFQEVYTPWQGGDDPAMQRGRYYGTLVELTESQVALLKDTLKRSIVRWRSRDGQHAYGHRVTFENETTIEAARKKYGLTDAQVAAYKTKAGMFKITPSDEPLAKFIYCIKVDGPSAVAGSTYRPMAGVPQSVLETGIDAP